MADRPALHRVDTGPDPGRRHAGTDVIRVAALLAGFAAAVGVRVWAGQPQVSQSATAGLLFAAMLLVLVAAVWQPAGKMSILRSQGTGGSTNSGTGRGRAALAGIAGAAVLCVPPLLRRLDGTSVHRPEGSFILWGLIVSVVAVAEEAFLRGALYTAVERAASAAWSAYLAIGVSAVAFGLLHVPLYGWGALPLDLAVGVWLGVLREVTGTATAPAVTHTVADLAGWWLR